MTDPAFVPDPTTEDSGAVDTDRPPQFDAAWTGNCREARLCESCKDQAPDGVVPVFAGAAVACVSLCDDCREAGHMADLDTTAMWSREGEHAIQHLGLPSTEMLHAVLARRRGQAVDRTAGVPFGPYKREPQSLGFVLSGGYTTPVEEIDPADIEAWLRACAKEAKLDFVEPAEVAALRMVAEMGPALAEVVGGWLRRANTGEAPRPFSFDPAALARAQHAQRQQSEPLAGGVTA